MKIILLALLLIGCSKQLDESILDIRTATTLPEKTPKPWSWHGTIHHSNGCITEMYAWTTFSLVGHYLVTTYNYDVIQTCGSVSVTTSWQSSGRESSDDEMITELRKNYTDIEIAEIFKTLKPKTVYFGMQSNGCGLYANVDYSVIIAGVLGVVSTEVYEVCGGVTTHLAYYYNLQWYKEAANDERLTDEQRLMIASVKN